MVVLRHFHYHYREHRRPRWYGPHRPSGSLHLPIDELLQSIGQAQQACLQRVTIHADAL